MVRLLGGWPGPVLAIAFIVSGAPALADTPREMLTHAAFGDRDKATALVHIQQVRDATATTLAHSPGDQEAAVVSATALGYQAKLTGSRSQALAARHAFEALVARYPNNPEAQAAIGAWHVGVVYKLGGLMARATVGAQRATGLAALDRSVALSGDRAMFAGLAGMLRLELDAGDTRSHALLEAAAKGSTPTPLDRIMKRAATAVLGPLRQGNTASARALAIRLLPFGWADRGK